MSCQHYQDALLDLGRHGEVDPFMVAAVEAHIEHCRACMARLQQEEALTAGLRALATSVADARPSADLEGRLTRAFQAHHTSATVRPAVSSRWREWVAAAAAVTILAGAAVEWSRSRMASRGAQSELSRREVRLKPDTTADTTGEVRLKPDTTGEVRLKLDTTADVRLKADTAETVRPKPDAPRRTRVVRPSGFVLLPGAGALPRFESGTIQRVSLEPASLPSYGIEITPDAAADAIVADLLVGQDGQPRAIRLVGVSAETRSRQ